MPDLLSDLEEELVWKGLSIAEAGFRAGVNLRSDTMVDMTSMVAVVVEVGVSKMEEATVGER